MFKKLCLITMSFFMIGCQSHQVKSLPFYPVKHYFSKITVDRTVGLYIQDEEMFNQYFGAATLMGKNGKPTKIDFNKYDVVAVIHPQTSSDISLIPEKVEINNENKRIFIYTVKQGKERTFSITPTLLIRIDKAKENNMLFQGIMN